MQILLLQNCTGCTKPTGRAANYRPNHLSRQPRSNIQKQIRPPLEISAQNTSPDILHAPTSPKTILQISLTTKKATYNHAKNHRSSLDKYQAPSRIHQTSTNQYKQIKTTPRAHIDSNPAPRKEKKQYYSIYIPNQIYPPTSRHTQTDRKKFPSPSCKTHIQKPHNQNHISRIQPP
jgi:hypothetical protein